MVPLDERPRPKSKKALGKQLMPAKSPKSTHESPHLSKSLNASSVAPYDGVLEDEKIIKKEEEVDEDAINSDLDDSSDASGRDGDDDDDLGETMLCLYSKVQRVKNKWKCTLKDGILTTNQKE